MSGQPEMIAVIVVYVPIVEMVLILLVTVWSCHLVVRSRLRR